MRKAGYVLPFATAPSQCRFVLLGQERSNQKWSGFGGGLEGLETYREGAAREAWEESLGFLDRHNTKIQDRLDHLFTVEDTGHAYFALEIPYEPALPEFYRRAYLFIQHCGKNRLEPHCTEKIRVAWVPWKHVKRTILQQKKLKNYPLQKTFCHEWLSAIQEFDT